MMPDSQTLRMQIAAYQDLLRDKVAQLRRHNLRVQIEPLRDAAVRHFVADLITQGRVSAEEFEAAALHFQVERLNQELQAHTARKG